jgi:hypothetical protein
MRIVSTLALVLLIVAGCSGQTAKKKSLKLTATAHSETLTWTQGPVQSGSPAVSSNNVYRGTTSGGETLLASITPAATTYVDSAVTAGTTYYYEVTAVNSAGEGPRSNEESGTIPNPQVPGAPVLSNPTVVSTTAPCVTSPYQVWNSIPIPPQSGNFEIQMDAQPSASGANAVIMLGPVASVGFKTSYVYMRFWTTGVIQALNGPDYEAMNPVSYAGAGSYHLTIDVNKAASTYSAYVGTTTRTAIAYNYAFHVGSTTAPIGYITLYQSAPTGMTDTICNTTILSYPLAS